MNIRYFFVADVIKRKHITIEHCPTDEMIADFFTKPLGGAKFRRFRNIIMNISHDEYGHVDMDELMAIHEAKMKRRVELVAGEMEDEPTVEKVSKMSTVDSQECVGEHAKRTNSQWASLRVAHKNTRGQHHKPTIKPGVTYARAVTRIQPANE